MRNNASSLLRAFVLPLVLRFALPFALLLLAAAAGARAQGFALEGAVIDSRDARSLGVVSERGDIETLFRAQKTMTYGILRSIGIEIELLPPELRQRLDRLATGNVEAFRAFSQGLDLKDQGRFVEAKAAFQRAATLDPNFLLAVDQQRAMPDTNLGTGIQTRAVLAAAATTAIDRGKTTVVIDTQRALAVLASGQSVVLVPVTRDVNQPDYTVNQPGSTTQFSPPLAAGLAYSLTLSSGLTAQVATATTWRGGEYRVTDTGVLESLGNPNASGFLAKRGDAVVLLPSEGPRLLADGVTNAYWGSWLSVPGASASITRDGVPVTAPTLGFVDYVYAEATRQMPTSSTAVFAPAGGSLGNASGTVAVNFATRIVELRNLAFDIGTLAGTLSFSGLNGTTSYLPSAAAGTFTGSYSSGACTGCPAFSPTASSFGGSFAGRNADGLIFSTFLQAAPNNRAAGVHLFTKTAGP